MTQQQYNNFDREFGWEDTIEKDSEYVLLPDGLYHFTVIGMERTRHTPNPQNPGKLPACNKAIVSIKIVANEGETELRHNLFLHSSTEGMLSAFFAAIGQKKKGEPLRMNWNTIIGATGVCKVGTRQYNNNNYNEVKSMLYPEDVDYTSTTRTSYPRKLPATTAAEFCATTTRTSWISSWAILGGKACN